MLNKRVMQMVLAVALVGAFLLAGVPAMAQGPAGAGTGFVDADGDGICDSCDGTSVNYVDADGDGICDNIGIGGMGAGLGTGAGFVDADGDGICDNCDGLMTWTRTRANQQLDQQLGQQARQGNGRER